MDQALVQELLEREEREEPFCQCGAPTVPVARDGALWLECSSLQQPKSRLRRLATLDFEVEHTRRVITELFGLRFTAI
jgi:hypothetical protein